MEEKMARRCKITTLNHHLTAALRDIPQGARGRESGRKSAAPWNVIVGPLPNTNSARDSCACGPGGGEEYEMREVKMCPL